MAEFQWPDATFDAVVSTSALQHALRASIQRTIAAISCVLKPGGVVLVDFPCTDDAYIKAEVAAGTIRDVEPDTFVDERPHSDDIDGFCRIITATRQRCATCCGGSSWSACRSPREGSRGTWVAWARKAW